MTSWATRTVAFARFALLEYVRSGRAIAELLAVVLMIWLAFWPRGYTGLDLRQFMSLSALFMLALAAYTTAVFASLGNRAVGYVFLARPLGRGGYLLGILLAVWTVLLAAYLLLVALVVVLYAGNGREVPGDLSVWALGSLAILLDAAVASLYTLLLAPLVVSRWQRFVALAVLALGLASYLDPAHTLGPLGTLAGAALLPVVSGLDLAARPHFDAASLAVVVAQFGEAALLFGATLVIFRHRDVTFSQ